MSNGKIIPGQEYDDLLNLAKEFSQQMLDVPSFVNVEGGVAIEGNPNDAGSIQTRTWNLAQIQAQLAGFYRVYVGNGSINLPRILLALNVVWETSSASGSYSESGEGASVGSSVNLSLTAQGRAQGSASVLPELVPVWYSLWTQDLPVVDYYFFLPANATRAEILAQASVVASLWLGSSTTILDWPVWKPMELAFSLSGQKVSASAEAVARCSVSINSGGDVSEASSSGSGTSQDAGQSVRPANFPLCLNPGIVLNASISETVTVGAGAVVTAGTNFPGQTAGAAISVTATGNVSPPGTQATAQTNYPENGIYGFIDAQQYQYGYSAYRVRTFDFAILPHTPQITLLDFTNFTGADFVESGPGQYVIMYFGINSILIGIWFFISTETQPDLSAYGVSTYLKVTIASSDNASTMAGKLQTDFTAAFSTDATATRVNGFGTLSAVQFVDAQNGPSARPVNGAHLNVAVTQIGT